MSLGKQLQPLTQLILDWRKIELKYVVRNFYVTPNCFQNHTQSSLSLWCLYVAFAIFVIMLGMKYVVLLLCVHSCNVINIDRQPQKLSELQAHACHKPFTNSVHGSSGHWLNFTSDAIPHHSIGKDDHLPSIAVSTSE